MIYGDYQAKLQPGKDLVAKIGFNPYYPVIENGLEDPLWINQIPYINLASNNYLGLATDSRVKEACIAAINQYGASLCGTPIATGNTQLFQEVEAQLAMFVGLEAAVVLPSCYQANNGLFSAICSKDDLIVVDHYAHSSLIQGIKAVGCKIRPFLHNNMDHLRQVLEHSSKYRQVFVVTESVFSTEGSIAPLAEIVALSEKFKAVPVVDDSHGIGVLGPTGRGILEAAGLRDFQGIYTASLGKALANFGGVIAGKAELIEYLKYYSSHLIYSTALPPASLGGILEVLKIIETDFVSIRNKIFRYKNALEEALIAAGFVITPSQAPIISIQTGETAATLQVAKRFFEERILTTPFIEPSVPPGEGRVRLIAGANLTEETITKAVATISRMNGI